MGCHLVGSGMTGRKPSQMLSDNPQFYSPSHDSVIRVCNEGCSVIETHEQKSAIDFFDRDTRIFQIRYETEIGEIGP
jgi:hypothetical protein